MIDLDSMTEGEVIADPVEAKRDEWLQRRLGKITCSRFGDLMGVPKTKGELFTQTAKAYLHRVIAERLGSYYSISARSMDWGNDNEPHAIKEYSLLRKVEVDSEPFRYFAFTNDIGGTPDGLIGTDGCIEVKCPYDPAVHVNTMITQQVPSEYQWQVDGHMLVTGRQWCDFISFDPRVQFYDRRLAIIRVERDEVRIECLKQRLFQAVQYVKDIVKAWTE